MGPGTDPSTITIGDNWFPFVDDPIVAGLPKNVRDRIQEMKDNILAYSSRSVHYVPIAPDVFAS
jgi:hypothetical protein